ncbi:MAG TPA: adenosine deaminase [Thermomicrobiaceae bacterium]|nr:adenosine deaminase [Thermomicrobiaceae bacterium]
MSLESYLRAAPKAELHVHLEGAIQPATLLELARRNGVELPVSSEAEVRDWFTFRDFDHFVEIYVAITRCLRTVEDYQQIVRDFGAEMARQNIRYAEVTFSPSTHHALGVPQDVWFSGLSQGREEIKRDFGVEINWVFDVVRNSILHEGITSRADYTTGVAIEGMGDGVVALGLGGAEAGAPPQPYAPWFERARAAGLHSNPHAGELAGPESIWGALNALGAERIGHGVRASDDPALVRYLAERRIPIEISPTSNLRLGVYPDYAHHPLRALHDAGVIVTINSDDPPLFNTTLNDEVLLLPHAFGFDLAAIDEILLNPVRHSFLPPERKTALEAEFRAELAALKVEHLGTSEADE